MKTVSTKQLQIEFTARAGTISEIINNRVIDEERRQNALCWAWRVFVDYRRQELPQTADVCAIIGALVGVYRSRRNFVTHSDIVKRTIKTRPMRISDTAIEGNEYRLASPERVYSRRFPQHLQCIVELLCHGYSQTEVASELGISTSAVNRRVEQIRAIA